MNKFPTKGFINNFHENGILIKHNKYSKVGWSFMNSHFDSDLFDKLQIFKFTGSTICLGM